jgi:hypothetical protein
MRFNLADAVQLVGLVAIGAGIGMELTLRCDWCLIFVTAGSVIFAIGTKLKGK